MSTTTTNTTSPPPPPPKPQDAFSPPLPPTNTNTSTPTPTTPARPPPPPFHTRASADPSPAAAGTAAAAAAAAASAGVLPRAALPPAPGAPPQDPGDHWLPDVVRDKSKHDLAALFAHPPLLAALAHATSTAPPSVAASQAPLHAALDENIALAARLNDLEARLGPLRAATQARLLSAHALERQWRQKQSDMDRALAPFSPSALYQKLSQGVAEQEMVARALEESFLEGGDGGVATEREAAEWVRRYREAKKVYYARRERKERWDEGRVGGWR